MSKAPVNVPEKENTSNANNLNQKKMKRHLLNALFTIVITGIHAQHAEDGYYITRFNDSVTAKIKVPLNLVGEIKLSEMCHKVDVVDSTDSTITFAPGELKSFGFLMGGQVYTFVSKPVKEGYNSFLQALVVGESTSLYQYIETVQNTGYYARTEPSLPFVYEHYTLEKPGGKYLFLNSDDGLDEVIKQLKIFYQKNSFALLVIDKKFKAPRKLKKDITEVVETVNKYSWVN